MIFNMTGGGGSQLNFKVVSYATEELLTADTPKENTIGIVTTTPIPSWYFAAEQPENMATGDVWMITDVDSPVSFNAVKKNNITVYPYEALQFVDGALAKVPAYCYINGAWTELWMWNGELYKEGREYEDVTGGWTSGTIWSGFTKTGSTVTKNADHIYMKTVSDSALGIKTVNKIDMSAYSTLNLRYTSSGTGYVNIAASFPKDSDTMIVKASFSAGTNMTKSISLKDVDTEARIGIFDYSNKGMEIYEIWLS